MNVVETCLPWNNIDRDDGTTCKTEDDVVDHIAQLLASGQYYSWAGLALLAVNPCKNMPQVYTMKVKELYNSFEKEEITSELKPHIYAVAARARHRIIYEIGSANQIISISGDSGSGKTYSAKQILEFLSTYDLHESHYDVAKVPGTLWQIWCSVPVLTAFGNAQTECNDNSSRFGKLLQLQYDDGKIVGAFIQTYLLEKTRVAFQGSKERNFHIFHQLLSGLSQSELSSLYLSHKTFYRTIPGAINLEDRDRFLETKVAMMDIGITEKMKQGVFMVLAAIIHLGNITFVRKDDHFDIDRNSVTTAQNVSRLLGLGEVPLRNLLTSKQIQAPQSNSKRRGSIYHKPAASMEECNAKRDCLMRLLYERLFLWIVSIINNKVQADGRYQELGILDIFGFEIFENNSLEQLCINYANERLQQFFVRDFIKSQQLMFLEEDIYIELSPNLENEERLKTLDSSISILGILDEECSLRRNTSDVALYQRIATTFKKSSVVSCPPPNISTAEHPTFIFRHYAGQVSYSVHHMLEKNTDHIPSELNDTLGHRSLSPFVRQLFHNSFPNNRKHTVLGKFKNLLDSLIKILEIANVHYVRCIKAAPKLIPDFVEKSFLKQQLKSSGIMEIIFINQHHFPVMMNYDDFEERYAILSSPVAYALCNKDDNDMTAPDNVGKLGSRASYAKEVINVALGAVTLSSNVFFGKKTLFLTERALLQLENKHHLVRKAAAKRIQRNWRVFHTRRLLEPNTYKESKSQSDVHNEECETKEPGSHTAGAQSGIDKNTEDKPITDGSNNVEECGTIEPFYDATVVSENDDEKSEEEKFDTDEGGAEECNRTEISSDVTDPPECDDERPKEDESITDECNLAECDKKECKSDENNASGENDATQPDRKETQKVEEEHEIPIKSKPAVSHKAPNSGRSFYVSKGIISRRPLAKVPVRLHIKRTCIPNSHFLPISELPRGLEDALC